jgi:hypothetical protein
MTVISVMTVSPAMGVTHVTHLKILECQSESEQHEHQFCTSTVLVLVVLVPVHLYQLGELACTTGY